MPSYPIRPTFPVDVRSTPSVTATREGTAFRFDLNRSGAIGSLGPSRSQFFAALDALAPGSLGTLTAAVPSDPSDPIHRAFEGTAFVTVNSALAAFTKATLALTDAQIAAAIAAAAALPN